MMIPTQWSDRRSFFRFFNMTRSLTWMDPRGGSKIVREAISSFDGSGVMMVADVVGSSLLSAEMVQVRDEWGRAKWFFPPKVVPWEKTRGKENGGGGELTVNGFNFVKVEIGGGERGVK